MKSGSEAPTETEEVLAAGALTTLVFSDMSIFRPHGLDQS